MNEPLIDIPPEAEKLIDEWVEANDEPRQADKATVRQLLGLCAIAAAERLVWTRCTGMIHGFHKGYEENRREWIAQAVAEGKAVSQIFAEILVEGLQRYMKEEYPVE